MGDCGSHDGWMDGWLGIGEWIRGSRGRVGFRWGDVVVPMCLGISTALLRFWFPVTFLSFPFVTLARGTAGVCAFFFFLF